LKLLFDENLSPRLARILAHEYPDSVHVRDIGLKGATDALIWDFARANSFVIVSKDTDFRKRSFVEGAPPKVIWLDVGNAGTAAIAFLLRQEHQRALIFEAEAETSVLIVSIGPRAV
jgi:predicted nuclease of predicted toxin-antitoxin system